MPRSQTEIPHFAFNHHRIGIHSREQEAPPPAGPGELVPLDDVTGLSRYDQDRNLGLAYLQFSDAPRSDGARQDEHGPFYRERSLEILEQIARPNHDDVEVEAALARLHWRQDSARTLEHAKAVAAATNALPDALATACFTLGSTFYDLERPAEAQPWLERTVLLRPTADVWMMLSDCRSHAGDVGGALQAARNAAEMAPDRPRYVERLVELLERSKEEERSDADQAAVQREAAALKQRVHYLREYRARVDQTPKKE
jgi:tetratricopeptide (TPR) repeat protein